MASFSLSLALEPDQISGAVETVQTRLEAEGVDARAALHVALTVDELLTNASTHGQGQGKAAAVRLELQADRVCVEVVDGAAAYDPRGAPKPELDAGLHERPIGGLGVHLVVKLSRDLAYARVNDRNRTNYWIARSPREG